MQVKRFTVLRSPFVLKKAREQFEMRTFARLICVYNTDPERVDYFLKHVKKNLDAHANLTVTHFSYEELPPMVSSATASTAAPWASAAATQTASASA